MTISSSSCNINMTLYSVYFMFFMALFLWARRRNVEFMVDSLDTRYILVGLVLYCFANLLSRLLIRLELKSESFEIVNSHFLLLGIGFFLYYKLKKVDE